MLGGREDAMECPGRSAYVKAYVAPTKPKNMCFVFFFFRVLVFFQQLQTMESDGISPFCDCSKLAG